MSYKITHFPKMVKETGLKEALKYDWNKSNPKFLSKALGYSGLFVIPLVLGIKSPTTHKTGETKQKSLEELSESTPLGVTADVAMALAMAGKENRYDIIQEYIAKQPKNDYGV